MRNFLNNVKPDDVTYEEKTVLQIVEKEGYT